jgi:hypothetical protein
VAPLDTQGFIFAFTHIAFERQTGVRFFEQVPGGTGSSAESTLVVFLAVDDVFIPAGTFGDCIFTCVDRNINISQWLTGHPDTRSLRIIAAIFRHSVKGGADDLTGPATVAFADINFYRLYGFLFSLQNSHPPLWFSLLWFSPF